MPLQAHKFAPSDSRQSVTDGHCPFSQCKLVKQPMQLRDLQDHRNCFALAGLPYRSDGISVRQLISNRVTGAPRHDVSDFGLTSVGKPIERTKPLLNSHRLDVMQVLMSLLWEYPLPEIDQVSLAGLLGFVVRQQARLAVVVYQSFKRHQCRECDISVDIRS